MLQPLRSPTQSQAGTSRTLCSPAGISSRGVSTSWWQFPKNCNGNFIYLKKKQKTKQRAQQLWFLARFFSHLLPVPPSVTLRVTLLTRRALTFKQSLEIAKTLFHCWWQMTSWFTLVSLVVLWFNVVTGLERQMWVLLSACNHTVLETVLQSCLDENLLRVTWQPANEQMWGYDADTHH